MTFFPLGSLSVTTGVPSIVFSSIPTSVGSTPLKDLMLVIQAGNGNYGDLQIAFNNTAGTSAIRMSYSTSAGAAQSSTVTGATWLTWEAEPITQIQAIVVTHILDFSSTDKGKTFLSSAGGLTAGADVVAGLFNSTNAINSFTVSYVNGGNFLVGSTLNLYGIAG